MGPRRSLEYECIGTMDMYIVSGFARELVGSGLPFLGYFEICRCI